MKNLLAVGMIFASINVFAGPEDHMYESCYSAVKGLPANVYSTLCFDDASLNLNNNTVEFSGYVANMPSPFETETLYRKNEDFYFFVAKKNLINKWESGCGEGLKIDLVVTGEADFNGYIDPKSLSMTALVEETNDTCHSKASVKSVEFKLTK